MLNETFEEKCNRLEHWETDAWAPEAVLRKEILTQIVIDPCTGTGIMADIATSHGYCCFMFDVDQWNRHETAIQDFLEYSALMEMHVHGNTVFMNPPFSKSEAFVKMAMRYGARKIVCFQRYDWFEGSDVKGKKRGAFWRDHRPARIWVCGDRANCHLHSQSADRRKKKGGMKQTYAFFVWEEGHAPAAITGHLFKSEVGA